jgi:hypothetical protein
MKCYPEMLLLDSSAPELLLNSSELLLWSLESLLGFSELLLCSSELLLGFSELLLCSLELLLGFPELLLSSLELLLGFPELLLCSFELLLSSSPETSPQPINITRIAQKNRIRVKDIVFIIRNIVKM